MSSSFDTMEGAQVLEVARGWSFWDVPLPPSIERRVKLPDALRPSLALVIQGVRRCGKSTLMRQMISRYRLDPTACMFLNCEDPRLSQALSREILE
jgi:predicted AAA+ superfamily ATPase